MECCGRNNWTDWINVMDLPPSCCPVNYSIEECTGSDAFDVGCNSILAIYLNENLLFSCIGMTGAVTAALVRKIYFVWL